MPNQRNMIVVPMENMTDAEKVYTAYTNMSLFNKEMLHAWLSDNAPVVIETKNRYRYIKSNLLGGAAPVVDHAFKVNHIRSGDFPLGTIRNQVSDADSTTHIKTTVDYTKSWHELNSRQLASTILLLNIKDQVLEQIATLEGDPK
jgi:hypothetical protein